MPGVAAGVFPAEPERNVYNNALLERGLAPSERAAALDGMEAAYAAAGVDRFAAWVHETDREMRAAIERRGYALDQTTRAMGVELGEIAVPRPELELAEPLWADYLRTFGLPAGLLSDADRSAFHVSVARVEGQHVATAMAFDWEGDCGIFNVGTVERARRRGLGTALTALQLHDALARGCRTASVQSTKIAEGVYFRVGFRDLGAILEFAPLRQ